MDELFPVLLGLLLGMAFATDWQFLKSWWVRAALVLVGGIAATVASGEYMENWGFALVDCGEVALAAWIGGVLTIRLGRFLPDRYRIGSDSKP